MYPWFTPVFGSAGILFLVSLILFMWLDNTYRSLHRPFRRWPWFKAHVYVIAFSGAFAMILGIWYNVQKFEIRPEQMAAPVQECNCLEKHEDGIWRCCEKYKVKP
jgi:hypothetical protein